MPGGLGDRIRGWEHGKKKMLGVSSLLRSAVKVRVCRFKGILADPVMQMILCAQSCAMMCLELLRTSRTGYSAYVSASYLANQERTQQLVISSFFVALQVWANK